MILLIIDKELIAQAKEVLGDRNAEIIAELFSIEKWNEDQRKGCCPNPAHDDSTPSCSYNPKTYSIKCFGCGFTADILDAYMFHDGCTFSEACEKLFSEAGIKYDFGERGVISSRSYRYPKPVYADNNEKVYAYWKLRGISKSTVDYLDMRQDMDGNTLFQYYDLNDVLVSCKVRPSRAVRKPDIKIWYLPGADHTDVLFNINRINSSQPLIICSGEGDCASLIECGFLNSVSINGGDQNTNWIGECWDFLQQFEEIILVPDKDESGKKFCKDVSTRLGEYRIKVADVPSVVTKEDGTKIRIKDVNDLLYLCGKSAVQEIINNAKESEIPSIVDYSDVKKFDMSDVDGFTTSFAELDAALDKFYVGTTTILTGIAGCVDAKTEYFNGHEWRSIADFRGGDKVLQYNTDGTAELVTPSYYYKIPCDDFWEIKNSTGVNQCVSDEHNLVYITSKGNLYKTNVQNFVRRHNLSPRGASGKFITSFQYNGPGLPLSDTELRIMCAVVCDGHFPNHKSSKCRINIKKPRKINRLKKLLDESGIPYIIKQHNPKDPAYRTFIFNAPIKTKLFSDFGYQCNNKQLSIIAEEVFHWDGCVSNGRQKFFTSIKSNADFIQFAFSATGRRSRISVYDRRGQQYGNYIRKSIEYCVSSTDKALSSMCTSHDAYHKINKIKTGDGYKYCFTVPSGMLVLRREGVINVTGNSGKSSLISTLICQSIEQDFPCFVYSGELSNPSLKNWIDSVHVGQRNLIEFRKNSSVFYKIKQEAYAALNRFYKGKIFFYKDGFDHKTSHLMDTMESVVRRFGVKTIIIDNMSSVDLENDDNNKYIKQDEFIRSVIEFSKRWQVVCIVVLHPKKMEALRRMSIFDLQGSVSAVNLAHRVLSLYRVQPKEKEGIIKGNKVIQRPIKYDILIDVLKDRFGSGANKTIGLYYDVPSRRFFDSEENLDYQYAWDKTDYTGVPLPYPPPQLEAEREFFGQEGKYGQ